MKMRAVRYCLVGLLLALGAPSGWLFLQLASSGTNLEPRVILAELAAHWRLYAYMLIGASGAFGAFGAVIGHLFDQVLEANQRLEKLVVTDEITDLKNGRYFRGRLQEECARATRDGSPLALVVADLDFFKRVNDRYGHAVGDEVLSRVAKIISASVRSGDSACRIGGEEFAILCPGTAEREAVAIAERIQRTLAATAMEAPGGAFTITISLGVATWREGLMPTDLFRSADGALYAAKARGRNRVVCADRNAKQDVAVAAS